MSTSSNNGGGFSIGVIYGLIVSIALYLVLSFLFPINSGSASAPQTVAQGGPVTETLADAQAVSQTAPEIASAVTAPIAPAGSATPIAPDVPVAAMTAPVAGETTGVTVGGAGDTSPATLVNPIVAGSSTESGAPAIETESAAVPDIGNETATTTAPSEGAALPATTTVAEKASAPAAAPGELDQSASGPAVEVFAVAFTGDTSKPMLAIILEDTLETSLQPLVDTGQPLNFALPAGVDSSESAQSIRESGFEVVAMLPPGMSRTDGLADNIARYMQNVPVAVAVLDADTNGVMLNRDAMEAVLKATRPAGLGVITFAGTGDLVARDQAIRVGVPYGNVVQIIDKTLDVDLILQALDRAAFDALTKGSSIVFARTKPETIDAIVRWMGGAFAQRLQVVPVSVAIQRLAN